MERKTHKDGKGWYIEDQSVAYDERRRGADVDRLAAYENTGMEPGDIEGILERGTPLEGGTAELMKKYLALGSIDQLQELAKAEKAGRLVVLPPDDGEDTAICAVCHANGETYDVEVKTVGAPKEHPSLLSFITQGLADDLGVSYRTLLSAMLNQPSVIEAAEMDQERGNGAYD